MKSITKVFVLNVSPSAFNSGEFTLHKEVLPKLLECELLFVSLAVRGLYALPNICITLDAYDYLQITFRPDDAQKLADDLPIALEHNALFDIVDVVATKVAGVKRYDVSSHVNLPKDATVTLIPECRLRLHQYAEGLLSVTEIVLVLHECGINVRSIDNNVKPKGVYALLSARPTVRFDLTRDVAARDPHAQPAIAEMNVYL